MAIRKLSLGISVVFALVLTATAQEFPSPSPSPILEETPSATPEQSPSPLPTASPARTVRLSFVPPPMEGTISLGIFDEQGKLVRVLHREAKIDNFTVAADSLETTWDGKNESGEDLPPGRYRARGYTVGELKVEDLGNATVPSDASNHVWVKLVINPLSSDTRSVVDLGVGCDSEGSFIKTMDGLPLFTVSKTPNLVRVLITKAGAKSVDVWQDDGAMVEQFRVSHIDKMMAFDCGFFELK